MIIPVYRVEAYLDTCVRSVLDQTFSDFELILVDDGSPDRCGKMCDAYAAEDSRIHVIHQKNAGLSAARNAGTALAEGDYLAYIDSDDAVHPQYLERLYTAALKEGADIAVSRYTETDEAAGLSEVAGEGAISEAYEMMSGRDAAIRLMTKGERFMITAWGKLYKKKLAGELHYPPGRIFEDEYVTYRVFYQSERCVLLEAPLYSYRVRGGSITQKSKRHLKLPALKGAVEYFKDRNDPDALKAAQYRYRKLAFLYKIFFFIS